MKKLLSLLLAALLCVCSLTPVFAEAGDSLFSMFGTDRKEESFPYTLNDYKLYFDILADSVLGVTPVWTTTANGAEAALEGFGVVKVETNAEGKVTRLSTAMTVEPTDQEAISNLGMVMALMAMTSKASEDISFIAANADSYTEQLLAPLYELIGRIGDAVSGKTISATGDVYGDTATFSLSIDMTKMTMTLELVYEP